jgi:PAS domain S-box-containing protein
MKTIIIGGGRGCRAIIDLAATAFLQELSLDIVCVVDINDDAPGMVRARELGIKTLTNSPDGFSKEGYELVIGKSIEGIELIIELTGRDDVLQKLYHILPPGVKIIDHTFAQVFWDLVNAQQGQKTQLKEITELEEKVERERNLLESFIYSANDWISIKDLEGRYLLVNPTCADCFGMEPDDFIGKKPEEILDKEVVDTIRKHDKEVLESFEFHTYDEVYIIQGRERQYQTVRFPMTDLYGQVEGVCTIARDVTHERELRDQLVQAGKLAAVGRLAAGVAHEINNPLTGILAYAEDMADELPSDSPLHEDLKVIIQETIRCRDIVRNLLDFARLGKLHLQRLSPNYVVEQSLVLVHKLPQFRDIEISTELAENIPDIICDLQQLQQVILNLMLNASDAMEENGRIYLKTQYNGQEHKCIIAVEDEGPGIDEEIGNKIFEPFFSTKGTNGLGLAVSWGILERHQGTIEAGNVPTGGAVFEIIVPAASGIEKNQI